MTCATSRSAMTTPTSTVSCPRLRLGPGGARSVSSDVRRRRAFLGRDRFPSGGPFRAQRMGRDLRRFSYRSRVVGKLVTQRSPCLPVSRAASARTCNSCKIPSPPGLVPQRRGVQTSAAIRTFRGDDLVIARTVGCVWPRWKASASPSALYCSLRNGGWRRSDQTDRWRNRETPRGFQLPYSSRMDRGPQSARRWGFRSALRLRSAFLA